jgi:hypothetical protein
MPVPVCNGTGSSGNAHSHLTLSTDIDCSAQRKKNLQRHLAAQFFSDLQLLIYLKTTFTWIELNKIKICIFTFNELNRI